MARKFGGVKITARHVAPRGDVPRDHYPEWVKQVLPNHEATLAVARMEADAMLSAGESCVWICRSRHKLSGVTDHRYFVLTEDIVRLLGGYIPTEVVQFLEQKPVKGEACQGEKEEAGNPSAKPSAKARTAKRK